MYSLKYKVTTSTCDSEGRLKLYSALQMMQDCSEMWIDSEPEVKDYFLQQNMAQLLATRQVEIIRVPDYKEELTVTTSTCRVASSWAIFCSSKYFFTAGSLSIHISEQSCIIWSAE